jgi:anti-sigma factor RsiW
MLETMSPCDDLVGFADGELEPDRAAAFRSHLRTCEACRRGLVEAMQLNARLSELAERATL